MRESPRSPLSVVIVSHRSNKRLYNCLKSLMEQDTTRPFEIVVVDGSAEGTARRVCEAFPDVKLIEFSERKFPGQVRNEGIKVATGEIIAFLYVDYTAPPHWVEAIVEEHRSGIAKIIGGPVGNGCSGKAVATAAYFCEFYDRFPGQPARFTDNFPASNLSYQRGVLENAGGFSDAALGSDLELHWRLQRQGNLKIYISPRLEVYHHSIDHLGDFLRKQFEDGYNFADMRLQYENFSTLRRWTYALLWWLL